MTKDILMSAERIEKSFRKAGNEIPVLRGVDFSIRGGEMVAITGSSGAGKSTLLHILGTLELPTRGRIWFQGDKGRRDVLAFSEPEVAEFRNRSLGFVFQFHHLLPEFSALENVMMPALVAGYSKSAAEGQAKELLGFVGLEKRLQHRPAELSGGEQQRVAIARAVILRPKLILADEVTGNLDSANGQMVMDLLVQLNQVTGVSILLVTHDLKLANRMHRILVMQDGALLG